MLTCKVDSFTLKYYKVLNFSCQKGLIQLIISK